MNKTKPLSIISIDFSIAKPCAYAQWDNKRLCEFGFFDYQKLLKQDCELHLISPNHNFHNIATIEDCYINIKKDIAKQLGMVKKLGILEEFYRQQGFEVVNAPVFGRSWTEQMFNRGKKHLTREQAKKESVRYANVILKENGIKEKISSDDLADAVCIGAWFWDNHRFDVLKG